MKIELYHFENIPKSLLRSMLEDRSSQFIQRLGWPLSTDSFGRETDEYDNQDSYYLVAHDKNVHIMSMRLRSFLDRTMLEDIFATLFVEENRKRSSPITKCFEISRFCRNPKVPLKTSLLALEGLNEALSYQKSAWMIPEFLAVTYESVCRFLSRSKVDFVKRNSATYFGENLILISILPYRYSSNDSCPIFFEGQGAALESHLANIRSNANNEAALQRKDSELGAQFGCSTGGKLNL